MPLSLARLSASESSHRNLSSAVFITNIAESDFRYRQPSNSSALAAFYSVFPRADLQYEFGSIDCRNDIRIHKLNFPFRCVEASESD